VFDVPLISVLMFSMQKNASRTIREAKTRLLRDENDGLDLDQHSTRQA